MEKHQRPLPPSLLSSVITPPFISSFPSKHKLLSFRPGLFRPGKVPTETVSALSRCLENMAQEFLTAQIEGALTNSASHLREVRPR